MTNSSTPFNRRRFLTSTAGAAAGITAAVAVAGRAAATPLVRARTVPGDPFKLGVASGDPLPDGTILWTRLAPNPTDGGGMPDSPVNVDWEVATDEGFTKIVQRGTETARPEYGHSVHADARGLEPAHDYFYRFRAGNEISPVGRTRTAPAPAAAPNNLRLAFASCHNWQDGFYPAYGHMADEDLDFVAFLGDYIYESVPRSTALRTHEGTGEPYSLVQYRNRHGQYKTDPDLQKAHAAFPWIVTLDDHEIDNNWADEIPQDPDKQPHEQWLARRKAAFQAYYEHMPLRRESLPHDIDMQVYRRLRYGNLAAIHVLDTRQYRSDQPADLAGANDPSRTMTGADQERWLVAGMTNSGARWNLLANQVMWASNDRKAGVEQAFDFDNWDGYRVQRRRLLEFFGSGRTSNPVVLTGDRHATWVCDLKPDFDDARSPVVGAEITGTSISSGGDQNSDQFHQVYDPIMAESPHWKYIDTRRGYIRCGVTAERLEATLRTVSTVRSHDATVASAAQFVVENGRPGVHVVSG